MDELKHEIERLGLVLNELAKDEDATFGYQWTSGALVWSDELPPPQLPDVEEQILLYLLRYRTSLIEGKPIEAIESCWLLAKESFPDWPGFADERCRQSASLSWEIGRMRDELEALLDESEDWQ